MSRAVNPLFVIKAVFFLYFILNSILFSLREYDTEWWFADYQSYAAESFDLHLKAFVFFVLYLIVFIGVLIFFAKKNCIKNSFDYPNPVKDTSGNKRNSPFVFLVVVFLLICQAVLATMASVGVAGGVGEAPIYALPFLLVSPDGFYYAYALTERNKKRLTVASFMFVLSNVLRGWAGFIVPLAFVFYIRKNGFSRKTIVFLMLGFLIVVPVLFVVRDYFRGGYSHFELLVDSGFTGMSLLAEYSEVAIKLILSRFDLYSNYIGISLHFGSGLPSYVCIPIVENTFAKIIYYPFGGIGCTQLGRVLPGEIYEIFVGKGTSYSIVGGFFALPFEDALIYFISYLSILGLSSAIIFRVVDIKIYSTFFIFLVMSLLFQGWMYEFIYNFLGFIIGIFLLKITWSKNISP